MQIGLWVVWLGFVYGQSRSSTSFRGGVECEMNDSDLTNLIPGVEPGSWEVPVTAQSPILPEAVLVRECWCARLFEIENVYCPPEMNTCSVMPWQQQKVTCRSDSAQVEIARAIWPFALFLLTALIYILVVSEVGKLARGFVRRNCGNLADYVCQQRRDRPDNGQVEGRGAVEEVIRDGPTSSLTLTLTIQRDEENGGFGLAASGNGPNSDEPQHMGQPTAASITTAVTTDYPRDVFGRRSNFDRLYNELCRLRDTHQHERVARLWYSAWVEERRLELRAERQARLRNWWYGTNRDENEHVPQERTRWDTRRTLKMELKTKRFHTSMLNEVSGRRIHDEATPDAGMPSTRVKEEDSINAPIDATFDVNLDHLDENSCAICLCELEDGDIVGDIPCQHFFHKGCLKSWLTRSNRCPLCQQDTIETFEEIDVASIAGVRIPQENPEDREVGRGS